MAKPRGFKWTCLLVLCCIGKLVASSVPSHEARVSSTHSNNMVESFSSEEKPAPSHPVYSHTAYVYPAIAPNPPAFWAATSSPFINDLAGVIATQEKLYEDANEMHLRYASGLFCTRKDSLRAALQAAENLTRITFEWEEKKTKFRELIAEQYYPDFPDIEELPDDNFFKMYDLHNGRTVSKAHQMTTMLERANTTRTYIANGLRSTFNTCGYEFSLMMKDMIHNCTEKWQSFNATWTEVKRELLAIENGHSIKAALHRLNAAETALHSAGQDYDVLEFSVLNHLTRITEGELIPLRYEKGPFEALCKMATELLALYDELETKISSIKKFLGDKKMRRIERAIKYLKKHAARADKLHAISIKADVEQITAKGHDLLSKLNGSIVSSSQEMAQFLYNVESDINSLQQLAENLNTLGKRAKIIENNIAQITQTGQDTLGPDYFNSSQANVTVVIRSEEYVKEIGDSMHQLQLILSSHRSDFFAFLKTLSPEQVRSIGATNLIRGFEYDLRYLSDPLFVNAIAKGDFVRQDRSFCAILPYISNKQLINKWVKLGWARDLKYDCFAQFGNSIRHKHLIRLAKLQYVKENGRYFLSQVSGKLDHLPQRFIDEILQRYTD